MILLGGLSPIYISGCSLKRLRTTVLKRWANTVCQSAMVSYAEMDLAIVLFVLGLSHRHN